MTECNEMTDNTSSIINIIENDLNNKKETIGEQ